ncbi:MAG: hypothetical protein JXB32_20350 [Deltaproteobacteria bacterium]|nr:hypothetical protein [Deltaproteobacteria bacterium]
MRRILIALLTAVVAGLLFALAGTAGCDEGDCLERGAQCTRASECCNGACNPAEYPGVYRCN